MEDITGSKTNYTDSVLPFVCADTVNLRSHYELTPDDGWILVKSTDKIKDIIEISGNQIFDHHKKFVDCASKKNEKPIINIFLRKADYSKIENKLEELSKTIQKPVLDTK